MAKKKTDELTTEVETSTPKKTTKKVDKEVKKETKKAEAKTTTKEKKEKKVKVKEPSVYTLSTTLLQTFIWQKVGDRAEFISTLFTAFDNTFEGLEGFEELRKSFSAYSKSEEKMGKFHEYISDTFKSLKTEEEREDFLAGLNFINANLLRVYKLI